MDSIPTKSSFIFMEIYGSFLLVIIVNQYVVENLWFELTIFVDDVKYDLGWCMA